jgi:hypothetical protein
VLPLLTGGQVAAGSKSCQPDQRTSSSEALLEKSGAASTASANLSTPARIGYANAHSPSRPANPSTAARAVSSDVWPYTSPVIAIEECPSRSATALICTPD